MKFWVKIWVLSCIDYKHDRHFKRNTSISRLYFLKNSFKDVQNLVCFNRKWTKTLWRHIDYMTSSWKNVHFRFITKQKFVKIIVFIVWFLLDIILECIVLINGIKTIGYICCFKLILVLHSCNACSAGNDITLWYLAHHDINFAGETGMSFLLSYTGKSMW